MQAAPTCKGARRKTERSFGGDVQGVGSKRLDEARQPTPRQQSQPDVRIGRAGYGPEAVGADHFDTVAHRAQFG